ncbi:MAG TPA: hypothetical protein VGJ30_15500 [Candidatus Angelobacter sp.]|jgi:hypothetical protein
MAKKVFFRKRMKELLALQNTQVSATSAFSAVFFLSKARGPLWPEGFAGQKRKSRNSPLFFFATFASFAVKNKRYSPKDFPRP